MVLINARFEFAAIFALSWQFWKKNSLIAENLRLVKMERYTIQQRVFIIEQYFKNNILKTLFLYFNLVLILEYSLYIYMFNP